MLGKVINSYSIIMRYIHHKLKNQSAYNAPKSEYYWREKNQRVWGSKTAVNISTMINMRVVVNDIVRGIQGIGVWAMKRKEIKALQERKKYIVVWKEESKSKGPRQEWRLIP